MNPLRTLIGGHPQLVLK